MDEVLREKILERAESVMGTDDLSHDKYHMRRTLALAEYIAEKEDGDLDILIPMVAFHDAVVFPKNSKRTKLSAEISAMVAHHQLMFMEGYDKDLIPCVTIGIMEHDSSWVFPPSSLESAILQDADSLEKTGAMMIMRAYCSSGQMGRGLYCPDDPFSASRAYDPGAYTLDYILKKMSDIKFHTETAKDLAQQRLAYLHDFVEQVRLELSGPGRGFQ